MRPMRTGKGKSFIYFPMPGKTPLALAKIVQLSLIIEIPEILFPQPFPRTYLSPRERSPLEEQIARRRFPHVTRQLWTLLQRGVTKYCRALWPLRVIDSMLLLMSAFIIGERKSIRISMCP